jgi:hypothetical protein
MFIVRYLPTLKEGESTKHLFSEKCKNIGEEI